MPDSAAFPRPVIPRDPTVADFVHYVARGSADGKFPAVCRAAIVTEVDPDDAGRIGVATINPTGFFFHSLAAGGCEANFVDHRDGGSWHWPERAPEQAQRAESHAEARTAPAVPLEQRVAELIAAGGRLSDLIDAAIAHRTRGVPTN